MIKIKAKTLNKAYKEASKQLKCNISKIDINIIQNASNGILGFFKKDAIIMAERIILSKKINNNKNLKIIKEIKSKEEKIILDIEKKTEKANEFLKKTQNEIDDKNKGKIKKVYLNDRDSEENKKLSAEIESKLIKLMNTSCYNLDTIEVDVFNKTAHIFIDGEDVAALIGKEGYRYYALSYMLFNWLNTHYDLYLKLEIAAFINEQTEKINLYLKYLIKDIYIYGKGKTKSLNGIFIHIALERLRMEFPDKYIAIRIKSDGSKFILIEEFKKFINIASK